MFAAEVRLKCQERQQKKFKWGGSLLMLADGYLQRASLLLMHGNAGTAPRYMDAAQHIFRWDVAERHQSGGKATLRSLR